MSGPARSRRAAATATPPPGPAWPMRKLWPLLAAVTLLAYLPVLRAGFIWDDNGHVTRPDLRSLDGLVRIWTEVGATQQYYPVLHTAFWIEHGLWGDAPLGYHLLNILLHAVSAGLFVLVLRRLAVPGAGFAGFVFALHPVAVESVAWISEQKNTLSLVFYLLAALSYLDFEEGRDGDAAASSRRKVLGLPPYAAASVFFLLALFSKSVTATLPAALLVVIWWRRGRLSWRRDVLPLAPWFVAGGAAGFLTSWVESHFIGARGADFGLSALERCLLAGRVAWFYLGKMLWPADLIFIYPRWTVEAGAAWQYLFPLAWIALLGALLWRRQRGLLAGLLFFVGSLVPALGFVNVFPFVFSYVADHFQYLACLGLIAPAAAGRAWLGERYSRTLVQAGGAALLLVLGILTWRQTGMYQDLFTLYQTTLDRNPAAWMAENNLGTALVDAGRTAEAVPHFEQGLRLKANYAEAENNLGNALNLLGRSPEAIPHFARAIRFQADYAEAYNNLGDSLMNTNRPAEGILQFQQAVRLKPGYALAHCNLGQALARNGRPEEAIPQFQAALRAQPDYPEAELYWANTLTLLNRLDEAVTHYQRAIALDASSAQAQMNLAFALAKLGRMPEATQHYNEAVRLGAPAAR